MTLDESATTAARALAEQYLDIARLRGGSAALVQTVLRTRSRSGRDLLAHAAAGVDSAAELLEALRRDHASGRQDAVPRLDAEWALALARVLGAQNLTPSDPADAVLVLEELRRRHGPEVFEDTEAQQLVVDRLWQAGERELLTSWLPTLHRLEPDMLRYLRADLLNPFGDGGGSVEEWHRLVAEMFEEHGVEPVTVSPDAPTPFDGLGSTVTPGSVDGPLVTVVMTSYRPTEALLTSVRSICAQSWRNLEVLVVDDASPAEDDVLFDRCAALDPRVRVHRMERNRGTYVARNAGLDLATGDLVTFQDADDWSHPRRIERQAQALLADETAPASRSLCLRVSEDLRFQRPGYQPMQANAASLMIRREQALATVGYFDQARKGADTEYRRRLEAVAGRDVLDVEEPLAMVRMNAGSLSRADFTPGWHHASRWVYRLAYGRWHDAIREGAADARLPREPGPRRFAIPQRFAVEQEAIQADPPRYDAVLLSDWRLHGPTQRALLAQADLLREAGMRVGLAHRESYGHMSRRRLPLVPQVVERLNDGRVDFVALDQLGSVATLLVRSPDVLQHAPADPSSLEVNQVLVVADSLPTTDGELPGYSVGVCDETVRATFGVEPTWVSCSEAIRDALASELPTERIRDAELTLLDDEARPVRRPQRRARPVVGRRLTGAGPQWPDSAREVFEVLPDDDSFDVRIAGDPRTLGQVIGHARVPTGWVWYPLETLGVRRHLAQLDFYVDVPHPSAPVRAERDVVLAIASGCVTILPPRYEPVYGAAALYAEPADVPALVRRLHADPDACREHAERAAAAIRERFGPAAVRDRVARTGPGAVGDLVAVPEAQRRMPASGAVPLVLLVNVQTAPRLGAILRRLAQDPVWGSAPITIVHTPRAQPYVDAVVAEHPDVVFLPTASSAREELADVACDALLGHTGGAVCVARLPRQNGLDSWLASVSLQAAELRDAAASPVPLLLHTSQCPQEVTSAYVHDVLGIADLDDDVAAYLGAALLSGAEPRLEAIDPESGDIRLLGWLNAAMVPGTAQPPWRYRFVLTRAGGAEVRSEPVTPRVRVDSHGRRTWEELVGTVPLVEAHDGAYAVSLEVDTGSAATSVRRRLQPSKGLLFGSRAVTMTVQGSSTRRIRYLTHTVGDGTSCFVLVQRGRGALGRLRWAATMLRKDLGFVRRGRAYPRMVGMRVLRLLTKPLFWGRSIWLIGERTDTAQDNGFHLFRHIREHEPRRSAYYVIDPASPQASRVAHLGHVVAHSSWRHQLLMLHADVLANAYSMRYLVPSSWLAEGYTRHLAWRIGSARVYLKHGIHLNANAFKRGLTGYDMLLTAMRRETEALRAVSGYDHQIREIGMPRYDGLERVPGTRTILFMPTWRQYLTPRLNGEVNHHQIPLEGSDYERFITGLLTSPRLHALLERHDFRLQLLPHYNVADHFDGSVATSDRVGVADPDRTSFQDILRGCDVFITDHSSVHFDIAYMGIPIIYVRFDEELYETRHASRSWFSFEEDGYGPVAYSLEETLDELERLLAHGCEVAEPYASRAAEAFTYRDRDNTARVVAAIDAMLRGDDDATVDGRDESGRGAAPREPGSRTLTP